MKMLRFLVFIALLIIFTWAETREELTPEWLRRQEQMELLSKAVCQSKALYGSCRGHRRIWYYNANRHRCEQFVYSNCGGNRNRFYTKIECDEFCTYRQDGWNNKTSKYLIRITPRPGQDY